MQSATGYRESPDQNLLRVSMILIQGMTCKILRLEEEEYTALIKILKRVQTGMCSKVQKALVKSMIGKSIKVDKWDK